MSFSHTYMCIRVHTHVSTYLPTYIYTYIHTYIQMSKLRLVILQDSTCLVCFTGNYPSRSIFYAVFMTTYSRETLVYRE